MELSGSILSDMVKCEFGLFRFALLFRNYAISKDNWHRVTCDYYRQYIKTGEREEYWFGPLRHRDALSPGGDGPALRDGVLIMWCRYGKAIHPPINGPTLRFRSNYDGEQDKNGDCIREEWICGENTHRIGAPAIIVWKDEPDWSRGLTAVKRIWKQNNEIHRDDGPALEIMVPGYRFYTWYQRGKIHREKGPAIIATRHGLLQYAVWMKDNQPFRSNGPIFIGTDFENCDFINWSSPVREYRPEWSSVIMCASSGTIKIDSIP